MRYFPDAGTMAMELEQGNLDVIAGMLPADYDRYVADGASMGLGVRTVSMNDVLHMTFGVANNPIFKDINVRKAIAHGVDWNAIGEMGYGAMHAEPGGMLSKISPYYMETGAYNYDPDLAKQILADAGYKAGDIKLKTIQMDIARTKRMTEGLQYYLSELGINLDITFGDVPSVIKAWNTQGENEIGWQNNPSGSVAGEPFQSWFQLAKSTGIFFHTLVEDDHFYEQYDKSIYTTDTALRKELYTELQKYMHDNYLVVPVTEYNTARVFRTAVFSEAEIANAFCDEAVLYLNKLSVR